MKAVVSLESQLKGREERSCRLNSQRGQRTDGAEREGRDGKREGRALWLIDHFLSEWSGVERRGIQFEDWDFDGEEICREGERE